jgi:hypothetical protein
MGFAPAAKRFRCRRIQAAEVIDGKSHGSGCIEGGAFDGIPAAYRTGRFGCSAGDAGRPADFCRLTGSSRDPGPGKYRAPIHG